MVSDYIYMYTMWLGCILTTLESPPHILTCRTYHIKHTMYTNNFQALPLHGRVQRRRGLLHIPNYGPCIAALPLTGDYHHRQLYSPCAVADRSD